MLCKNFLVFAPGTGGGEQEVKGLSKNEKGLMDMDNSVAMSEGRRYKGIKWQWEKYNRNHYKNKTKKNMFYSLFLGYLWFYI